MHLSNHNHNNLPLQLKHIRKIYQTPTSTTMVFDSILLTKKTMINKCKKKQKFATPWQCILYRVESLHLLQQLSIRNCINSMIPLEAIFLSSKLVATQSQWIEFKIAIARNHSYKCNKCISHSFRRGLIDLLMIISLLTNMKHLWETEVDLHLEQAAMVLIM